MISWNRCRSCRPLKTCVSLGEYGESTVVDDPVDFQQQMHCLLGVHARSNRFELRDSEIDAYLMRMRLYADTDGIDHTDEILLNRHDKMLIRRVLRRDDNRNAVLGSHYARIWVGIQVATRIAKIHELHVDANRIEKTTPIS